MGYLENMENAVEGGADFVLEQAPFYVQELINWEIAVNTLWAAFWLGVVIALPKCFGKIAKTLRECEEYDPKIGGWVLTVVLWIAMFFSVVGSLNYTGSAIKAYVAPRVVIVEKLAELNK